MNKLLLKTEPEVWSWEMQMAAKTTIWDGVRNFQASNNLKKMQVGELAFFYHSGKERAIVGIVVITSLSYLDISDSTKKFVCINVETIKELTHHVTLSIIKKDKRLQNIALVKQSRLSVMPIDQKSWNIILEVSKTSYKV